MKKINASLTTLVSTIAYFVGIDVSKARLDVSIQPTGEKFSVENTKAGVRMLAKRLCAVSPVLVVLEATAGLERLAAGALTQAGLAVAVVNPRRVRDFARALDVAKTDSIDGDVLARFGESIRPKPGLVRSAAALERDAMYTRRRQLMQALAIERNHLASAQAASVRALISQEIAHLQKSIARVDVRLRAMVAADSELAATSRVLQTARGVGEVTSTMLVTLLPELGKLSNKQIARLVGVAPLNDDSGLREGKRHCSGGRADVRTALYMPTLSATRFNPVIRAFYQRLLARGKAHKVAMVACMRKFIAVLNAMVRDNTRWTDNSALSH